MTKFELTRNETDENSIIIKITDGDYKDTFVKIINISFDKDEKLYYEMELPKDKVELFKDDKFKDIVGEIVGDMVKKCIDAQYKTQEEMTKIELEVGKLLKDKNVKWDDSKLLVEIFMQKGFLLSVKDNKIVTIDIKSGKEGDKNSEFKIYDLWKDEDFFTVKNAVFGSQLVL